MIPPYLLLPAGLLVLVKSADIVVDGASSIAKKLGVPLLVIGLTIVAFGTSAPELIVNIVASLNGNTEIAIGNVLGSNIANILLILGLSAIVMPLTLKKGTVWKEIPFSILAILVMGVMVHDAFIDGSNFSGLTRIDGIILIGFFVIFLYYTFGVGKSEGSDGEGLQTHSHSLLRGGLMVAAGLVGLAVGGKWVVDAAVALATAMGVSQSMIGLTIVAVGTSLPELTTSVIAAKKGNADIAVGNVVGSNIFNIFWILGLSAIIHPLPFSALALRDIIVTAIAAILLFAFMFVGKRHVLERWQGIGFLTLYLGYLVMLVVQEIP